MNASFSASVPGGREKRCRSQRRPGWRSSYSPASRHAQGLAVVGSEGSAVCVFGGSLTGVDARVSYGDVGKVLLVHCVLRPPFIRPGDGGTGGRE